MKRIISVMFFALFALIASPVFGKVITVEVGEGVGVNLTPLFQNEEACYRIIGREESAGKISFETEEQIFGIEVFVPSVFSFSPHRATIYLSPKTEQYEIRVYFVPARAGLMNIRLTVPLGDSTLETTVWLKVVPVGTPFPYDATWDGKLNKDDAVAILEAIQTQRRDVSFFRCDINADKQVNRQDLILVRGKLGLNPYDFNDDGRVDINDLVALSQKRETAERDRNGDGKVDIYDLVLKIRGVSTVPKLAPSSPSLRPLSVSWGFIRKHSK